MDSKQAENRGIRQAFRPDGTADWALALLVVINDE